MDTPNESERADQLSIPKLTGPATPEGMQTSKFNALKHGISSKEVLLKGESRSEYESLVSALLEDFQPQGALERELVETLGLLIWRKRRLARAERHVIREGKALVVTSSNTDSFNPFPEGKYQRGAALVPSQDVVELVMRYEAHLSREMDRTINRLERLQNIRQGKPVAPRIDVTLA